MSPDICLIQRGDLAIRLMRDAPADYALMARWLGDERVLAFYEGRDKPFSLERVIENYSPRVLRLEGVTPCIVEQHGAPLGYIQYYPIDAQTAAEYDLPPGDSAYGLDLFIGDPSAWNRGLGSRVVSLMCDYLFDTLSARLLTIDPEAWNVRAIRCYEKCGFHKVKLLPARELHEGELRDCWLMSRGPAAPS